MLLQELSVSETHSCADEQKPDSEHRADWKSRLYDSSIIRTFLTQQDSSLSSQNIARSQGTHSVSKQMGKQGVLIGERKARLLIRL